MDFTGTWDVVSSPDFNDEYLHLTGEPYVTLRQSGDFVKGEYSIGVMSGTINGGAHSDFVDYSILSSSFMKFRLRLYSRRSSSTYSSNSAWRPRRRIRIRTFSTSS